MSNAGKIKNLIFDFGGVIYQIDHGKQIQSFHALGLGNFELFYSQALQRPLFAEFEKGLVAENDFRLELNKILGLHLPFAKLDEAWNSILVDFMDESVNLLLTLRNRYRLFLLSNTNSIHYQVYTTQFLKMYGFEFNSIFEKTFWSFQIGMRKPDSEVYKFVMDEGRMNPDESVFIDDSVQNTTASTNAGLPAYWLKPGEKLVDILDEKSALTLDQRFGA